MAMTDSRAVPVRADRSVGTTAVAVALAVLVGAVVCSWPTTIGAIVVIGSGVILAGLLLTLVVAHGRAADLLLLLAIACITIPVDKYFGYREHVGGWPGFRVSATDLALIGTLPFAALGVWLGRTRNALPRALLIAYAAWMTQYCVSLLGAARPDLSGFELASALHALATALVIGALFRRELLRPIIALLAVQVLVHTSLAAAQVVTGRPIGAGWFKGAVLVRETLETGVTRIRPSGLFDHPIVYADMLLLTLPILFAGLFVSTRAAASEPADAATAAPASSAAAISTLRSTSTSTSASRDRLWRAFLIVTILAGLAGLALTLSRGAWISTAIAGVVFMTLALRHHLATKTQIRRVALGCLLATLLLAPAFAPRAYERLVASNEGNLRVRFELNWIALSMVEAHPFTGVGVSNFIPVMAHYDPTNVMRYFPATVHNLYLLEAAEAGIPGLLLFLLVFGLVLVLGLRTLKDMEDVGSRWVAAAIIAGLTGFLISQLADFSHRLEPLRTIIWINIGMLFGLARLPRHRKGNAHEAQ